jgi:hypothetical protein
MRHTATGHRANSWFEKETLPQGLAEAGSIRSASARMMHALRTSMSEGR